jgi:hypothetical protein
LLLLNDLDAIEQSDNAVKALASRTSMISGLKNESSRSIPRAVPTQPEMEVYQSCRIEHELGHQRF